MNKITGYFRHFRLRSKLKDKLTFAAQAQKTILSAAFILAVSAGVSAFLGLFKSRLLTGYFGVSDELAIFYTADRIPSFVYSVLVVGAISTVFIPVFTGLLKKDTREAWETASSVITISLLAFAGLSVLIIIFAQPIIDLLAVGKFTPEQVVLGANLMRIMMVGQLILVMSSFLTSILQSFRIFIIPALAPIFYNFGMILGIILLTQYIGIYAAAVGVIIGAVLHLVIQLPTIKGVGVIFYPRTNLANTEAKKAFVLMPPRIANVTLAQLLATINNSIAILISTASVIILKFAFQLQFFPVHLFGASMAAAALPVLSEHADPTEHLRFKKIFINTLHQMLYLVIPISILLLVLRVPIVRLVYGTANFPWEATVSTSYALAFFSLSIFAQSAVYLITRSFYALKDTFTPVKVFIVTMTLNVLLSVFFVQTLDLGVWAVALSFSITSIIDTVVLTALLGKRLAGFTFEELVVPFVKISYAAVFMGISLYVPLKLLDEFVFDTTRTIDLLFLTGIASLLGVIAYLFFAWLFRVEEIELFYKLLRRLGLKSVGDSAPAAIVSEKVE